MYTRESGIRFWFMWAFCLLQPPAPATQLQTSPKHLHSWATNRWTAVAPAQLQVRLWERKKQGRQKSVCGTCNPPEQGQLQWMHRKGSASTHGSQGGSSSEDDGIRGGSDKAHWEESKLFLQEQIVVFKPFLWLRGAQHWEGKKESVLWPTGEKANPPHQKRAREAGRAEGQRNCARTHFTCNSCKGIGIFITKKSFIKVSRDLP